MSTILLRIAAIVYAFYAAGHTYGAMYKDLHSGGPLKQAVFSAMRSYTAQVQGFTRSYWDFYKGFGFIATWALVLFAILSWQLASLARTSPTAARPLVLTLFLVSIPMTILAWTNFFAAPGILSTAATLLLGAAAFSLP
jgi:hypothetical protein